MLMHVRTRAASPALSALLGAWMVLGSLLGAQAQTSNPSEGTALYQKQCASCHGTEGRGDGPFARTYTAAPRNLREGFLESYSTADLVRRIRDGKALEITLDLRALQRRGEETEAILTHLRNMVASDWDDLSRGWDLYLRRCDSCHDIYGHPGRKLPAGVQPPRDLSDPSFQKRTSDAELLRAVRHGRRGMPALIPRITDGEARSLRQYVRLLSPGFELYSRSCANCHGDDGRGAGRLGEELGRPDVVLDRDYLARHEPEELRIKVWHMLTKEKPAMPHYQWTLSEAQAEAVVEFLRSLPK